MESLVVMRGLDPRIHLLSKMMDCRVIGERSDAVLRTAMQHEQSARQNQTGASGFGLPL
jgi:hypothetical protein